LEYINFFFYQYDKLFYDIIIVNFFNEILNSHGKLYISLKDINEHRNKDGTISYENIIDVNNENINIYFTYELKEDFSKYPLQKYSI
jgi:hypothetical protein